MADADAVAQGIVTGGKTPANPTPATQPNQTETDGKAAAEATWLNGLPTEQRDKFKRFKTVADLAQSWEEAERTIRVPIQDMTPEERERFLRVKLGRPESPDALELSNVMLPEGVQRSPDADKELREIVWKMQALPMKEQAKYLHEWAMKRAADGIMKAKATAKEQAERTETELRKEWGLEYDANERQIQALVQNVGGDTMVQYMNSPAGKDPALRRFLVGVAKRFSPDTLETGRVVPIGKPRDGMVVDFSRSPELSTNRRR